MKKTILTTVFVIAAMFQTNAQSVVADQCETQKGWSGKTPVTLSDDAKEGKHSLQSEGVEASRFRKVFETPVNTGLKGKGGFIGFWLFVSDAKAVETSPGILAISSSGKGELNAYHLKLKNLTLQNGWNKVALELTEESSKGGDFDGSNFNYFNFMQKTEIPVTFKIDNISFAKNAKDLK